MSYPVLGWAQSYPQNIKNRYVNNLLPTERTISEPPAPQNPGYYVVWDGLSWVVEGDKVFLGGGSAANDGSVAIGPSATAASVGGGQIAIGSGASCTIAAADSSIAIGGSATGANSICILGAASSAANTIAIGSNASASATNALAVGYTAVASAASAVAFGYNTTASVASGVALGIGASATVDTNSVGIGCNAASIDATGAAAPPATKLLGITVNGVAYRIPLYAP